MNTSAGFKCQYYTTYIYKTKHTSLIIVLPPCISKVNKTAMPAGKPYTSIVDKDLHNLISEESTMIIVRVSKPIFFSFYWLKMQH